MKERGGSIYTYLTEMNKIKLTYSVNGIAIETDAGIEVAVVGGRKGIFIECALDAEEVLKQAVSVHINDTPELIPVLKKIMMKKKVLAVKVKNKIMKIPADSIIRIESYGDYSKIFLVGIDKPIQSDTPIDAIEPQLSEDLFFQIHRCTIANKAHIKDYKAVRDGWVLFDDGEKRTFGRDQHHGFDDWFKS